MKYVFDNNTLSSIFKYYYYDNFPSFWDKFNPLVSAKEIISVKEVQRELKRIPPLWKKIKTWSDKYPSFFSKPTNDELSFITQIYSVPHFQQNISERSRLMGQPVADPFVIAKAKVNDAIVITQETFKSKATRIPNICKHFNIQCDDLNGFLNRENWKF